MLPRYTRNEKWNAVLRIRFGVSLFQVISCRCLHDKFYWDFSQKRLNLCTLPNIFLLRFAKEMLQAAYVTEHKGREFGAGGQVGVWQVYSTRFCWMAYLVSSALFFSCIFSRMRARYVLIVAALSESSSAISLLVFPEAIRRST